MIHIISPKQPDCILPKSFFEGRAIPNFHPESLDYAQWWDEQMKRCKEGYRDGGFWAPPTYYYHLNFKYINMLDHNNEPILGHPYFSQDDLDLFTEAHEARQNHQGIFLLTGRGFGKSYWASTEVEHKFTFYPASEAFVTASTLPFVNNLFNKVQLGLNSQPEAIKHKLLIDKADYIESGYEQKSAGFSKIKGYRSKIHKVAYDDKPGKTRGTRPDIHVFEETGSWTGAAKLKDCYKMTSASWKRGSIVTCFPIFIGTGGEMETGGSEDAKDIFYNPEAFNLRTYVDANGVKTGKFVPTYIKLEGFYEKSGVSDIEGAKEYKLKERERLKSDQGLYMQEIQEFPFSPEEAFITKGGDWLPIELINEQISNLYKDPTLPKPERGRLRVKGNKKTLTMNSEIEFIKDNNGPFLILEHPEKFEGETTPPDYLHVTGCDSFDAVAEAEKDRSLQDEHSKGCAVVYKRFYSAQRSGNLFVALLIQRTTDDQEFFKNTVLLNLYYNSKMLYEHTKLGIARYYINNKVTKLLIKRPKLEQEGVIKKVTATNIYGLQMPIQVKQHCIKLYNNYIKEYYWQMYFESQLVDARDFRFGSPKFDITMASAIALCADDELYNIEIREKKKEAYKWPTFQTNKSGNLEFNYNGN